MEHATDIHISFHIYFEYIGPLCSLIVKQ